MADSLISAVVEGVLSKLLSLAAEEVALAWSFKGQISRLQRRMEMIIAFLSDAESKSENKDKAVALWLKNLKGVVYDADLLLDSFQYEVLRQKIEVHGRFKNKVTDFFSLSKNPLSFRLKLAHKIRNLNVTLDDINKEASDIGLQVTFANAVKPSETGSLHCSPWSGDLTKIVGRDNDVSIIVQKLLSSDSLDKLSVISIVGMAGQGKTTLAHLVCENESVVRHFDKIIWVSVSVDFEETRILNHMTQFLTLANDGLTSKYALVEKLKKDLKDKKYLLVLDDVWNEDKRKWNSLKDALLEIQGSTASKIIVTTRNEDVVSAVQPSLKHKLERLSMADGWTMFKQKAFVEGGASETENLVQIGKQIVTRCDGVPLVLNVLGSLMASKMLENEWISVLNNKMWASFKDVDDLGISVIKLSYDHLSPSLKHCFAYCSILPKDSNIEKDTFVQLWMALGLLPYPTDGSVDLEDVGNKYFDTLLGKSLLQEATTSEYGNIKHCKMHDLVHDLAEQTSRGYCFVAVRDSNVNDVPKDVIHLSLSSPTKESMAHVRFQRLQTLFLEGSFPDDMLENFKFLRVLVLQNFTIKNLPKWIGKMKHLRYLDIAETPITKLPGSVTRLYNLQTLKTRYGRDALNDFPPMFGNLVNLRHLYGGGVLTGVGKLTSLRTLSRFVVSRRKGCLIEELGGLINLGGKLAIEGLEDIENMEEAQRGRLSEKPKLQSLILEWSRGREQDEYVLEGLRPHSNLRNLRIDNFGGVKLPSWMMSESFSALQNLVEIELIRCDRCEQVPTLGHLPHLKSVDLIGLNNVGKIGIEFYYDSILKKGEVMVFFPTLKELIVRNMGMLEEWVAMKEVYRSLDVKVFPNLEKLEIGNCANLLELPNSLRDCVALEEISIEFCSNLKVIPTLGHLPHLKTVELSGLNNVRKIGIEFYYDSILKKGEVMVFFPALKELIVQQMKMLEEWVDMKEVYRSLDVKVFPNLEKLEIRECENLLELPNSLRDSVALEEISIEDCDNLKVIPDLQGLTSLQKIFIQSCSNLKVIPDLQGLTSLWELRVFGCSELSDLPRGLETLTSLKTLDIVDCRRVSFVPDLECLSTLEYLRMWNLSKEIDELPTLPLSLLSLDLHGWPKLQLSRRQHEPLFNLTSFYLQECEELESLPGWLGNLSSLRELWISDCKKLRSLAPQEAMSRLTKLEELWITGCPLLAERCVQGSGTEWHKIQHIPFIVVDHEQSRTSSQNEEYAGDLWLEKKSESCDCEARWRCLCFE